MIVFKWEFIYLFIVNVIMFINKTVHDWNAYEFTLHMKDIIKCDEFHKEFPIIIRKAVEMMEAKHTIYYERFVFCTNISLKKITTDEPCDTSLLGL